MTTLRAAACGTHIGLLLHAEHHEAPCTTCLHADRLRTLELERTTPPPDPRPWTSHNGPTARYLELERQRLLWDLAGHTPTPDHPPTAVAASTRASCSTSPPSTATTRSSSTTASGSCAATATNQDDDTRRSA